MRSIHQLYAICCVRIKLKSQHWRTQFQICVNGQKPSHSPKVIVILSKKSMKIIAIRLLVETNERINIPAQRIDTNIDRHIGIGAHIGRVQQPISAICNIRDSHQPICQSKNPFPPKFPRSSIRSCCPEIFDWSSSHRSATENSRECISVFAAVATAAERASDWMMCRPLPCCCSLHPSTLTNVVCVLCRSLQVPGVRPSIGHRLCVVSKMWGLMCRTSSHLAFENPWF